MVSFLYNINTDSTTGEMTMIDPNDYDVILDIKNAEHHAQIGKYLTEHYPDVATADEEVYRLIEEFVDYNIYDDHDEIWTPVSTKTHEELGALTQVGDREVFVIIGDRIYSQEVTVYRNSEGVECVRSDTIY